MTIRNWTRGLVLALGWLALGVPGCKDSDPCQSGQTEGKDGMCYLPPNWGEACENVTDCNGGLFCGAPELPICTQVNCDADPDKDTICPDDYTCTKTGRTDPATVCVPRPPTSEECGEAAAGGAGGGGGAGPVGVTDPNLGTPCTMKNDPVCTGGAVCESEQLHYCVIFSCDEGCSNASICAAAGFTCYLSPPSPPGGVCIDI